MTIELREQVRVDRPPADCFRYLADFSTSEQWDPGVYRAVKRTPGPPAPGSEFALTLAFAGRRVPMRYRITELAPARTIVLTGEGDGFETEDRIVLAAQGGGTHIDYCARIRFTGRAAGAAAALRPWFVRMGRRAVAGLREALTRPAAPSPLGARRWLADRAILPALPAFTERGYLAMPRKAHSEFMDGRTAVVTGATGGIGLATACELARLGAAVVLVGRDPERLAEARAAVRDFAGRGGTEPAIVEADLSRMAAVRRAADRLAILCPRIDVLVNNAGALFAERTETDEGHERTLAINLLAPFLLTERLMPALRAGGARVINVASGGMYLQPLRVDDLDFHEEPFDGSKAYARAKRGLVALTEHWAAAHAAGPVTFNSMHPGWAATPGVAKSLPGFDRALGRWLRDARMGADTIVWLASAQAVADQSGRFWFDRRPHPTAVLPGTAVDAAQRDALVDRLRMLTRA